MTPQQPHEPEREPAPTITEDARGSLPFEYEDRSDGRHARIMKEVMAAMAWIKRRREQGFEPN